MLTAIGLRYIKSKADLWLSWVLDEFPILNRLLTHFQEWLELLIMTVNIYIRRGATVDQAVIKDLENLGRLTRKWYILDQCVL